MTRLAGQVALVTHAQTGLGAVVARRFAAEGARVVIGHDGDADSAARVVAEIEWRGGRAIAIDADVAHWPDVRRLFDETEATFGRLDILVNATAAAGARKHLTDAEARRRAEIDLFGAMLMCQEAIRLFGPEGGSIINLTALARCGLAPERDEAPDTAIDALTLGLARAFASRNVRVHAIAPGVLGPEAPAPIDLVDTAARNRQFVALPALERGMLPDAVARLAADLASEGMRGERMMMAG